MQCPICDAPKPASSQPCACGYDFASADASLVVARSGDERRAARRVVRGGLHIALASLGFLPGVLSGPAGWATVVIISSMAVLIAQGSVLVVRGGRSWTRARRRLKAAESIQLLPRARVV